MPKKIKSLSKASEFQDILTLMLFRLVEKKFLSPNLKNSSKIIFKKCSNDILCTFVSNKKLLDVLFHLKKNI